MDIMKTSHETQTGKKRNISAKARKALAAAAITGVATFGASKAFGSNATGDKVTGGTPAPALLEDCADGRILSDGVCMTIPEGLTADNAPVVPTVNDDLYPEAAEGSGIAPAQLSGGHSTLMPMSQEKLTQNVYVGAHDAYIHNQVTGETVQTPQDYVAQNSNQPKS